MIVLLKQTGGEKETEGHAEIGGKEGGMLFGVGHQRGGGRKEISRQGGGPS